MGYGTSNNTELLHYPHRPNHVRSTPFFSPGLSSGRKSTFSPLSSVVSQNHFFSFFVWDKFYFRRWQNEPDRALTYWDELLTRSHIKSPVFLFKNVKPRYLLGRSQGSWFQQRIPTTKDQRSAIQQAWVSHHSFSSYLFLFMLVSNNVFSFWLLFFIMNYF